MEREIWRNVNEMGMVSGPYTTKEEADIYATLHRSAILYTRVSGLTLLEQTLIKVENNNE
jgi:hypothetical protein